MFTIIRDEFQALRQMISAPPPSVPEDHRVTQAYTPATTSENRWSPLAGMSGIVNFVKIRILYRQCQDTFAILHTAFATLLIVGITGYP